MGKVFKAEWLQYFDDMPGDFERIIQGWDLAISKSTHADYTAGVTVGVKKPHWYILDIYRARLDFPTALKMIISKAEEWKPESIAIESNAYQIAAVQQLLRETALPVISQRATGDKVTRLMGLGADFENGRFLLRHGLNDFVDEFLSFPDGTHDDMLDALWHARERLRWSYHKGLNISLDDIGGI